MGRVEVQNISKRFDHVEVLHDISFTIPNGSILALLGPSGSGKTTLLRLLAGFEVPDRGRILVDDDDITTTSPAARRFGMVFQHYALFPHLSVAENISFGLETQRMARDGIAGRVEEVLQIVDLEGYGERAVSALSGGQQQRVAVARALAPEPRVLLLDEPLSNLDPALRERTRTELRERLKSLGMTSVFVTHEQEEAFDLGDAVAVIHEGHLQQLGSPDDLYEQPATRFVAGFVGRTNELSGTVVSVDDATGRASVDVHGARWEATLGEEVVTDGSRVTAVVRPERLDFVAEGLRATVVARRYIGATALFRVELSDGSTVEVQADPHAVTIGDQVSIAPDRPVRIYA